MTVNELVLQLQEIQKSGFGYAEVALWLTSENSQERGKSRDISVGKCEFDNGDVLVLLGGD